MTDIPNPISIAQVAGDPQTPVPYHTHNGIDSPRLEDVKTASGGTPGGSNTQIQFNDSGSFGGDSNFTWDKNNTIQKLIGEDTQIQLYNGVTGNTLRLMAVDGGGGLIDTFNDFSIDHLGGDIQIQGGEGDTGHGGAVEIDGGIAGTNSAGGSIALNAAAGDGSGSGGEIDITSGDGGDTGNGGQIYIISGLGAATSGNGGLVGLVSGNANGGNGAGGELDIYSGVGHGSGTGGILKITAGAGGGSGDGAQLVLRSGVGGPTGSTNGGDLKIILGITNGGGHTGRLNINGLPTSSAGLAAGDVWNNSGVLNIV